LDKKTLTEWRRGREEGIRGKEMGEWRGKGMFKLLNISRPSTTESW